MNIIKINIDFTNRKIEKKGINLVKGDYNSTKIVFEFDKDYSERKVFEIAKPNTDEAIFVSEIINNEVILTAIDENENNVSIFDEEGKYPFEVSLYGEDSKLTSISSTLPVKKEMVRIGNETVETYLPIFDQLMQEIQTAINETNNLNISVEREGSTATITITKKDGTTEVITIEGGGSGGTSNHAELDNLDYANSGHTGFQAEIDDLDDIRSGASLGVTAVQDNDYVHTDNNYTTEEKTKLAGLNNYDDTALSNRVANAEDDIDNLETAVAVHTTAIGNKQDKLTSANAGTNVTITEVDGVMKINSTGGSGGTSDYTALSNKPQINNVELNGNKTLEELGINNFSGDYNDLDNKPTIPSEVTESTVSEWGFTKNTGTYSKPSEGIPKTDLESTVQTSLGKADTAVQPEEGKGLFSGNYNDLSNKPTIPIVPTNVSSFTNDSGYLTLSTLPVYSGGVE